MKPRFSILNLLLVTTVFALAIVVLRLSGKLEQEKSLRLQLLQKGGILQVSDVDAAHVVQVTSAGERHTLRWRVYVPPGRSVTLNARLESVAADRPVAPRLPPNAIVVAERSPANAIELGPGEHVVSLTSSGEGPRHPLKFDAVGPGVRTGRYLDCPDGNLDWFLYGYGENLTAIEHTAATMRSLSNGETIALDDSKTFVLARYRAHEWIPRLQKKGATDNKVPEILIWIRPDDR